MALYRVTFDVRFDANSDQVAANKLKQMVLRIKTQGDVESMKITERPVRKSHAVNA